MVKESQMKNSVALWICIGCLVTGLTGCTNDLQKGVCGVGESGTICDGSRLVVCASGMEVSSTKCDNGCANNMCIGDTQPNLTCPTPGELKCENSAILQCSNGFWNKTADCPNGCDGVLPQCKTAPQTCTNPANHCSADNTKVVKCDNGQETEVSKCECGCDPNVNACKQCPQCNYQGTQCDPAGTGSVLKCEGGISKFVKTCTNGCNEAGTDCAEEQETCTDTENHCNADNTKVVKCQDGNEVEVSKCECGCDSKTNICKLCQACDYEGQKCDPTGTGSVLECKNGTESTVKTCPSGCNDAGTDCAEVKETCTDTKDHCNADNTKVVKCQDGNEVEVSRCECGCDQNACKECPKCDYKNTKCDSTFSNVLECRDGKEITVKTCTDEQICSDGKCVGIEAPEVCDTKGRKCLGRTVINCSAANAQPDIIEDCIETCTNGKCDDVACPEKPQPACFDARTILECDNGTHKMKKTSCGEGESCVSGECFKSDQQSSCAFETQCSADGSAIKSCKEGKVTYENCPVKKYCDASSGSPKCVSAMISEDLGLCDEEHFVSACDGEKTAYTCESGSLKVTNCNKNQTCISGICRTTTNKKIGDSCAKDNFDDTCIDNTPVTCDSKTKHIVVIENEKNCTEENAVCGSVESGGVQLFSCYEPCQEKGAILARCIPDGDKNYQTKLECVDLGNGKLGLDHINANYDQCDKECKEGKCVDYTEGIENVGKECEADKFKAYCKDSSRGVTCEENDEEKTVITVELCDTNELCAAYKKFEGSDDAYDTAGCLKQCKSGDPDRYECAGNVIFASTQFTCKKIADSYLYVPVDNKFCEQCGDDGKCK